MRLAVLAFLALSACASVPMSEVPERRATQTDLPPMKVFAGRAQQAPARSNAEIARDFLELSFEMESGRQLPILTRFEGPIEVELRNAASSSLRNDLDRLIARLRREAGIDITLVKRSDTPEIVIETVSRRELQRYVPQAACFVVPRVAGWQDFKRNRRGAVTDWTSLRQREQVSVLIPRDVSPQEVRDCLHEEVAQALGPLNDLYRLHDSVFNDDNFHTVLTGFDMTILRAYYAPELRSGMTRDQVAAALPGILARINPAGQRSDPGTAARTPRSWIDAIEKALGPRASSSVRIDAARRAVAIAQTRGWRDNRLAFSQFALGRLIMPIDPRGATEAFLSAKQIYDSLPGHDVQSAHVAMQLSAFALSAGQANSAIGLVEGALPAAAESENAALLSTLLMIKAEALSLTGRRAEAAIVRLDSLGWARYGIGSDREVRSRLTEISALSPARTRF
ncbi:ATP-dependent transcriptional regulator [Brevirhabdus pacifica]|uniref:ATP-dependent transcriptional regulator n=1 Tax=Brevirhabdus pacifica TaxID=1267768 RepID=A0A1U7DEP7_9RHOB|nr:DUF2927 domain-containing protein [Brevirhabdus pacifica]APX88480.1 ATP-dependent transcriptional regulator [Brevirhabdus pacifica]OWU79783.1 ATP-dependent transcriptional regulator [Loktanella sp. 22II-4b]PJJ87046.1 Protein of unknown function (DUF2927) [Brevirhabdus pacifica]